MKVGEFQLLFIGGYMSKEKYKLCKQSLGRKVIALGTTASILIGSGVYAFSHLKENNTWYSDSQASYTYDYNQNNKYESKTNMSSDSDSTFAYRISDKKDDYKEAKYKDFIINFNSKDLNAFKNYLMSLDSSYTYEDLYDIDAAYSKYKEMNFSYEKSSGHIISSDSLYEMVMKNNRTYFENDKAYESVAYSNLSKTDLKLVCQALCQSLQEIIAKNPNVNADSINNLLKTMRILTQKSSFSNASYSEDNLLLVNMNQIKNYGKIKQINNAFYQVIDHEAVHIAQKSADENINDLTNQMGVCYEFDGLKNNPLYWNWLLEAWAELQMADILNDKTNTYSTQISYCKSLVLISTLNETMSVEDFNSIAYSKDIQKIFEAFDAKSKDEQFEIIKMLYSIEIMQSSPSDFFETFKNKYDIDLITNSKELENLRLCLRIDILETMTKEFYKSLATKSSDGLSLNTIFYLIKVYESKVFTHLHYNEKQRISSAVEFFDFYKDIQDEFFEIIARNTNYNFDEIVEMYDDYSMNVIENGEKKENYSLTSLQKSTEKFFRETEEENYFKEIKNLRDMPQYCKDNGYVQTNYFK